MYWEVIWRFCKLRLHIWAIYFYKNYWWTSQIFIWDQLQWYVNNLKCPYFKKEDKIRSKGYYFCPLEAYFCFFGTLKRSNFNINGLKWKTVMSNKIFLSKWWPLTLFGPGGAIMAPPTMNPSAAVARSGLREPNFLTLFPLIFARSQEASFEVCFSKNWKI